MLENYKWKEHKDRRGEHNGWVCPFCHWETAYFELGYAIDKIAYEYCPMCGKDMKKEKEVKQWQEESMRRIVARYTRLPLRFL